MSIHMTRTAALAEGLADLADLATEAADAVAAADRRAARLARLAAGAEFHRAALLAVGPLRQAHADWAAAVREARVRESLRACYGR